MFFGLKSLIVWKFIRIFVFYGTLLVRRFAIVS